MELQRHEQDGITVIGLAESTEIDIGNCEDFKARFNALVDDATANVVLDASNVDFFDSAGMGSLLSLQKRLQEGNRALVIGGLNRSIQEIARAVRKSEDAVKSHLYRARKLLLAR